MSTFGRRNPGSSGQGTRFDERTIQMVWNKAQIIPGADPNMRRKDLCGAIIERNAYGDVTDLGTGWEIDHIRPVSRGGTDDLHNLQPLQWQNNRAKGDDYPGTDYCTVSALRR